MAKKSGMLLPVFSLPSKYGCGNFGKGAYDFIDLLEKIGFSVWQILPLGVPDEYNSPYMSRASFAGNPDYIDLDALHACGLLSESDLVSATQTKPYSVCTEVLGQARLKLLRKAYSNLSDKTAVEKFVADNPFIVNTVEFLALKEQNSNKPWQEWEVRTVDADIAGFYAFLQYEFYTQWAALKSYANGKGIMIMGDIPFYVSEDSADVYGDREAFMLDEQGYPTEIAGVPPDYFSSEGQLWGNPLYNWDKMKTDGFAWWRKRITHAGKLYDMVRLDHFRAFSDYWAIPASAATAVEGKWKPGPREAAIDAIKDAAGRTVIIAENLGTLDARADSLLAYSGFAGMGVFQFGFDGNYNNVHLPHNYTSNTVAYTGTHDNNTLLGFIWESDERVRGQVFNYAGYGESWERGMENIIKCMLRSNAETVIFPMQDILGFGADTRINTPGTSKNNWQFRITEENLRSVDRAKWKELNTIYSR